MKIGRKLIIVIVTLNLLGIAVLVGTTLRLAQTEITKLTTKEITNLAEDNAKNISAWL
jgi:hypothetical protein